MSVLILTREEERGLIHSDGLGLDSQVHTSRVQAALVRLGVVAGS